MNDEKTQTGAPAKTEQDARKKGEDAYRNAKASANEAVDHAKSAAHDAADHAKAVASDALETGKAHAEEGLNEGKNVIARQVLSAAQAAKSAAKDLRERDQSVMAEWADVAADEMTRAAEGLEGSDLNEIYAKVEDYARRQPAVFLAGVALAGFAAARFAKAARERPVQQRSPQIARPQTAEINHV